MDGNGNGYIAMVHVDEMAMDILKEHMDGMSPSHAEG
jgi:hypothetical protein